MSYSFAQRHIGPREADIQQMLKVLGVSSIEELVKQTVPQNILINSPLALDAPMSESNYLSHLKEMVGKNKKFRSLIGQGFYGTGVLPVIVRNIFENPCWYTSYTPYQAEISQGRLEALLIFQTVISSLTGFALSNCSMLDDAQSAAEAMRVMYNLRSRDDIKAGKDVLFVDTEVFAQVKSVLRTRAQGLDIKIVMGDFRTWEIDSKCFGAIVQYPAADGAVRDYTEFCNKIHAEGGKVTAYCDLLSLAVLKEPAAWGADIAVGSTQRLGLPMGYGGPAAGFLATREEYKRNIPGRIIGITVDRLGNKAFRLALQTREQHIKREKATSNVCTATALMATMSGMYAVYHGPEGLKSIARNGELFAHRVASHLTEAGYILTNEEFFDTIEIKGKKDAAGGFVKLDTEAIRKAAEAERINFYYTNCGRIRISFDELSCKEEAHKILKIFGVEPCCHKGGEGHKHHCPAERTFMKRESAYLTQPVFNSYHSEAAMTRFIKMLERKDISLTHSMIPLGSCTMKLNAAVEMMPLSWSELTDVHPLAPKNQVEGYMQLIHELMHDLEVITGFDACSLQPNSGAAGEYAGLTTIKRYFDANGQQGRTVMIIPTSAHGTNPASAAMSGFDIVLVGCDENGNINVDELIQKAEAAGDTLAGLMITYPSTHGVFEVKIKEIIDTIHKYGGKVYMDGANMNAQVGLTNPGIIGADICHLNLHKSFAMPHGGGGPGVGPICCTKELAPYLPGHPEENCISDSCKVAAGAKPAGGAAEGAVATDAVSAAAFGSPLLLPITHAYIKLLGASGLKAASEIAILNANYIKEELKDFYPTVYSGVTGRVAHECLLDCRDFKEKYGVGSTDIAKRLMDYGFHAPTLSFPVHETLMVEPTESEPKEEIDRFIEAMKSIKSECEKIAKGEFDAKDNPVANAPHPAHECCSDSWSHPYPRELAAYPLEWIRDNKFWPAVSRADDGYGDRNLVCTC
ncbi:MAG: aminomethyl-transferring glycine dehydrogenase [Bacteroidales bacterium]|nr:aminomethyl-transferring glycine dehydrogenase [Bacteroidales bacterium]